MSNACGCVLSGERRSSIFCGKGKRVLLLLALAVTLVVPSGATAGDTPAAPQSLLAAAQSQPNGVFYAQQDGGGNG
jgi:hypothetical protein